MEGSHQQQHPTSLLAALDCRDHVHLILGAGSLAATRAAQSLAAGARPVLVAPVPAADLPPALAAHIARGAVTHVARAPQLPGDLTTLGREEVDGVVDAVFVTDTGTQVPPEEDGKEEEPLARRASLLCRRLRIPVNVVDAPALCSFTLLSVHVDGPLQIGVTTNGRGCKLAGRIRREIAASLPPGLGAACTRLGEVRRRVREDSLSLSHSGNGNGVSVSVPVSQNGNRDRDSAGETDDSIDQSAGFNALVKTSADRGDDDAGATRTRRMRWLAQVCEYWPLRRLAAITDADVEALLASHHHHSHPHSTNGSNNSSSIGRIILAGSGPGHPDLVTRATYKALQAAELVLADKLVPAGVLALVPRRTEVVIARKFPGNADRAQDELLALALEGMRRGKTVVRLKQGDPFVYGRGGEEVAFFRDRLQSTGLESEINRKIIVLPGLTSALTAPLLAGIPPTQRDVADQVLVCTGTGKQGTAPAPPGFVPSRTVVFLMALHRIGALVAELTAETTQEIQGEEVCQSQSQSQSQRRLWPLDTPCAVVERASCPDQRVIRTTLRHVAAAVEQEGSRPPGLLVAGRACEALYAPPPGPSDPSSSPLLLLGEEEKRRPWVVEDGYRALDYLDDLVPVTGMAALGGGDENGGGDGHI